MSAEVPPDVIEAAWRQAMTLWDELLAPYGLDFFDRMELLDAKIAEVYAQLEAAEPHEPIN